MQAVPRLGLGSRLPSVSSRSQGLFLHLCLNILSDVWSLRPCRGWPRSWKQSLIWAQAAGFWMWARGRAA